jgi:hypothetical protein
MMPEIVEIDNEIAGYNYPYHSKLVDYFSTTATYDLDF